MKPRPNLFTVSNWTHDPKFRTSRFRCQTCACVIADGGDVVIERRGKSSHGYHAECFAKGGPAATAARLREEARYAPVPA